MEDTHMGFSAAGRQHLDLRGGHPEDFSIWGSGRSSSNGVSLSLSHSNNARRNKKPGRDDTPNGSRVLCFWVFGTKGVEINQKERRLELLPS